MAHFVTESGAIIEQFAQSIPTAKARQARSCALTLLGQRGSFPRGAEGEGGPDRRPTRYSVFVFRGKLVCEETRRRHTKSVSTHSSRYFYRKNGMAIRLDKWLWAARFFKTRSAAQQAVEGGKVKLNGERTKPARELKAGDRLVIHIGDYEWVITVTRLTDRRGPAAVARMLYEEDSASHARRQEQVANRKVMAEPAAGRHGRPTKRERRQLERWRRGS